MCGILAVFNSKRNLNELKQAQYEMIHRGPDYQSSKNFNSKIFLGHNRLSILDLNPRSNQPFTKNELTIVFNGEIYNYKELIVEHNLDVFTSSDTEVILMMFKKYGSEMLKFFNGMFAFIIYNKKTNNFFVARDRLGIKPLYFYQSGKEWIFSSEIAPLQKIINSSLDEFGLRQYKKLRMTLKGYTIYKDIKMFPPAHYQFNGKLKKYWSLNNDEKKPPDDEHLEWLVKDAVEIRKRSDVPVGSYLSGGLDSTILSYLLKPEFTWTVGFKEMNEFKWSEKANENLNSIHRKIIVNINDFKNIATKMIEKRLEPLSVPNEVLIYLMTLEVKKENTVVLSGEGADELFWGYDRIFKWAHNSNYFDIKEFDKHYSYGSHIDNEVLDFATNDLPGDSVESKIGYFFQIYHLHGLLRRLDNSTMLCSVEARVPFVDHRLVELLSGQPFNWKMGNSFKEPLKRIFQNLIPIDIINRKKVGFPVPLNMIYDKSKNSTNSPMDNWLSFNLATLAK